MPMDSFCVGTSNLVSSIMLDKILEHAGHIQCDLRRKSPNRQPRTHLYGTHSRLQHRLDTVVAGIADDQFSMCDANDLHSSAARAIPTAWTSGRTLKLTGTFNRGI